jgi:NTE family protein
MSETLRPGAAPAPGFDLVPDPQARAKPPHEDPRSFDRDGMGLSLSGGGYKAAAYHLGGLIRLNELGVLRRVKRITSVSGGSITAAWLGLQWKDLKWQGDVATNFHEVVVAPLVKFLTTANIDIWAGLAGLLLPFNTGADSVQRAYAKKLYGKATLQDLPSDSEGPRFVLLATNYELNSLWRFSRPYAADYRVGLIPNPRFPLSKIVAASSGFPPFFCPIELKFKGHELQPLPGADHHIEPFTKRASLADGGIYDNMGVEPIWKRFGILLISNAGDPFNETSHPPKLWPPLLLRILGMIHRQAENNRVRQFIAMAQAAQRQVIYWPLRNDTAQYPKPGDLVLPSGTADGARKEKVRLWRLKPLAGRRLIHHGYALANAATLSYPAPGQTAVAAKLPEV